MQSSFLSFRSAITNFFRRNKADGSPVQRASTAGHVRPPPRVRIEAGAPPPAVPWDDAAAEVASLFNLHSNDANAVLAAILDGLASRFPGSAADPLKTPTIFFAPAKLALLLSPSLLFRLPEQLQCDILDFLLRCMQARVANAEGAVRANFIGRVVNLLTLLADTEYPYAPAGMD